jgi:hypothetical protein
MTGKLGEKMLRSFQGRVIPLSWDGFLKQKQQVSHRWDLVPLSIEPR